MLAIPTHIWLQLAVVTAHICQGAETSPDAGNANVYEALNLFVPRMSGKASDLASLATTCRDARDHLRNRLARLRIDRMFYPEDTQRGFLLCLLALPRDVKVFPVPGSIRFGESLYIRSKASAEIPVQLQQYEYEIQLLQRLGTESNQMLLAEKLTDLCWNDAGAEILGDAVWFLTVRCGYRSLPGYILGICIEQGQNWDERLPFLQKYVVPHLDPLSVMLPREIRTLFGSMKSSNPSITDSGDSITADDVLNIIPQQLHRYLVGDPKTIRAKLDTVDRHIRGRPEVIRSLFQVGVRLQIVFNATWYDVSDDEIFQLAPYLALGDGFCVYFARSMTHKRFQMIAQLLRSLVVVRTVSRDGGRHKLYLACQVAIRFQAWNVLRGLLDAQVLCTPLSEEDCRKWSVITNWSPYSQDAEISALLRLLRESYIPGHVYPETDDPSSLLVHDVDTLVEYVKEFHAARMGTSSWPVWGRHWDRPLLLSSEDPEY